MGHPRLIDGLRSAYIPPWFYSNNNAHLFWYQSSCSIMDGTPSTVRRHNHYCCCCSIPDMVHTPPIPHGNRRHTDFHYRCFTTLGRLFTFEIAIRPNHELITSGPYAWVRHPSYTGICLTLLGATVSLCAPGTWLLECGISSRGAVFVVLLWLLKCAFVFRGMMSRTRIEDEVLKGAFGDAWDEYARRVPSNFVPGVI